MSTYAKARQAALLSLFLLLATIAAAGPATAARVAPNPPGPAAPAPVAHHSGSVVSAGPDATFWLLVGIVVVLAAGVLALAAAWRHDRAHRPAIAPQMAPPR